MSWYFASPWWDTICMRCNSSRDQEAQQICICLGCLLSKVIHDTRVTSSVRVSRTPPTREYSIVCSKEQREKYAHSFHHSDTISSRVQMAHWEAAALWIARFRARVSHRVFYAAHLFLFIPSSEGSIPTWTTFFSLPVRFHMTDLWNHTGGATRNPRKK